MEPGGSMPHSQGLSNKPYPEPNQTNPHIDTYLFKVHSNIVLPSTPRPCFEVSVDSSYIKFIAVGAC